MNYCQFFKLIACLFFPLLSLLPLAADESFILPEETFLLIDGQTHKVLVELGPNVHERYSPCSSFKTILCVMGYDAGILKDENTPTWEFQEGYDDYIEAWKGSVTPRSWMQNSCVWYSKVLSFEIGLEKIKDYLVAFEYGNQDASGGLTEPGPKDPFWIKSSLQVSPKEQVHFIQKMVLNQLPVSSGAIDNTKIVLFKEELSNGWKLYGKTGWSGTDLAKEGSPLQFSWFVGWVEKDGRFLPFAYLIRAKEINLKQRIPRVKQLIVESNVMAD